MIEALRRLLEYEYEYEYMLNIFIIKVI